MPGAIAIGLLIVVWIFVLTPWLLRRQKPIRKAGEAFDETRVVYEGGSGELSPRRRPRLSASDVHASDEDEHFEMVDVELEDELDDPLIADEASEKLDSAFASVRSKLGRQDREKAEVRADVVDGEVVQELPKAEKVEEVDENDEAAAVEEGYDEYEFDEDEASYELDETYIGPEDLVFGDEDGQAAPIDELDEEVAQPRDEQPEPATADSGELTEDELAFAARRRGRGGWDPEADKQASLSRYQRRQRTLIGLGAGVVVTLVLGFVIGGWAWILPAIAGVATAVYLYALRQQVAAEERLRRRRIQQLRRAQLGVRNKHDEALGIPERLRRPGAVVLEIDDDSPDFEYLDTYVAPTSNTDGTNGYGAVREVDFRHGRRAG